MARRTLDVELLRREQQSLRDIIETIGTKRSLQPLLDRILESACKLLNADDGSIALIEETSGSLRIQAAYNMPPDEVGSEVELGLGLLGKVYESKKRILFKRYGDLDSRARLDLDDNSVVGVPIRWRRQTIGAFGLGARPPRRFKNSDLEVLAIFAKHAAIAISNATLYERTQRDLRDAKFMAETGRSLGIATDLNAVVESFLKQIAANDPFSCSIALYEVSESQERIGMVLHGQYRPESGIFIGRREIPFSQDDLDPPLDRGETVAIRNVHEDPRVPKALRELQKTEGRSALAIIPLIVRRKRIGVVALSHSEPFDWPLDVLRRFEITASHLASAIEGRRQFERAQEQSQLLVVSHERQRIARELHDSVSQLLFSLNLNAQSLVNVLPTDNLKGRELAMKVEAVSKQALAEMRHLMRELSSDSPDPSSESDHLVQKLRAHAAAFSGGDLFIRVQSSLQADIAPAVEHAILRITQEAISNAAKHAHCSNISVRVSSTHESVKATIMDDGHGFAWSKAKKKSQHGHGLSNMQSRCDALGGTLTIKSHPETGTTVTVLVPNNWEGNENH